VTFEQLIDLWRKDRHPSTSELIERIGEKFDVTLSALPKKPKSEIARAWLAAVRAEPPSHLTARLEQLIRFATDTSARVVWPVFEALEDLPADPRYATLAVRCLVGEVRVGLTAKLTRRLINCVEAHGDASHFELLQAHDAYVYDEAIDARLTRVIEKGLAAKPKGPELAEPEWSRLLAQDWKPGVIAPKQDPLLAVYAEPADLGRRQVLADVLLEQGDPRGEFISLQLARASPKRQKALLKQHSNKWLGRLQPLAEDPVFEDGFVAELTVNLALKLNQYLLTLDAPEWATVRRVPKGPPRLAPTSLLALNDALPIPTLAHELATKVARSYEDRLGKTDKAVEFFRKALSIEADDLGALTALEAIFTRDAKYPELLEIYRIGRAHV